MSYELPPTQWPVEAGNRSAQAHLDRLKELVSAMNLGWWFINRVWDENSTGAISYPPLNDDSLKVVATGSPSMKVTVKAGAGFLAGVPFRKLSDTTLADDLVPPAVHPRIDTIGVNPSTGALTVYAGTEASSPTAPAVPSGIFKAGEVYLRVGSTAIYNSELSTGGYIQNLRSLFALPGDEPHTSGLTVSGGAFIHDGSSGDITLPANGLSIEFDYAGEANIDATDAAGHLVFRTGGSTDRLTLGTPAQDIILHGSVHDIHLSADGETLKSSGPNAWILEQFGGTGFQLKTDETLRYVLDEDGKHTWKGSLADIIFLASGVRMESNYAGRFDFRASDAAGYFGFLVAGDATVPAMIIAETGIQFVGDNNSTIFYSTSALIRNEGDEQLVINQSGATDGIMIQTAGEDRYQIDASGRHDIWGDAYFHDNVYVLGILYVDGIPITGDDLGGSSGYATITLPGTVFEPASVDGSDGPDSAEFGSNVLLFQVFGASADGYCMAPNVLAPLNFNDSQPVHVRIRWSSNSTSSNQVRFQVYTAPQGDGAAANEALNAVTTILDSNEGVANEMHVTGWVAMDMTDIAAGDAFALRLDRTPEHADDTLAEALRVHSVDIRYTRGAT
jgi:hypothetical protein